MEAEIKTKSVFNLNIVRRLLNDGFECIKAELNKDDNKYIVFRFIASDGFDEKFEQYKIDEKYASAN